MENKKVKLSIQNIQLYEIYIEKFKRGQYGFITRNGEHWHSKQEEALSILCDSETREFLYGGAAGGSKSWTGATWLLFMCLIYPESKWFIGREELKRIRSSTLITFQKVCKAYSIPASEWKYNGQDNFIQFKNGSRIDMLDLQNKPSDPLYERFGSLEYTGGWIEEGGEINFGAFDVLNTRIGRHLNKEFGLPPKMFVTCNPKKNWMYSHFYKPFKEGILKPIQKFLQAFVQENPFIDPLYIEQLQNTKDKAKKERLLKGNWDYDDNPYKLCIYDKILDLWRNDHLTFERKKYITADVARFGSDKAVIGVWEDWNLIEVQEFEISKTTEIQACIKALQQKHSIPKDQCIADADGVGCLPNNMEVLTNKGWKKAIDISMDDFIVSKNERNIREVVKPYEILHHPKERFIKVNDELAFTVCHTHFYKTRKEYGFKSGFWDDVVENKRIYHDDIVKCEDDRKIFRFGSTEYKMPKGGVGKFNNELNIDSKVFYEFLGWFLSEGYLDDWNNKNVIGITQTTKSIHNSVIKEILDNMKVNYITKIQKKGALIQYQFQHKELFSWLKDNCYNGKCKSYNKRFPITLKNTSKENIIAFCNQFINGDGYVHKNRMQFVSSSKMLIDDIQEILLYAGVRSRIHIKQIKGSKSKILGREITRQRDCYLLSEIGDIPTVKIEKTENYLSPAVEIKIPNKTRAILVRSGNKIFWTHNGGVVDNLDIIGFTNNGRPYDEDLGDEKDTPKYKNVQTQLLVYLAEKIINKNKMYISAELSEAQKEAIKEELDTIEQNPDYDVITLTNKAEIKNNLGRSPDYRDMILMRGHFDFNQPIRNNLQQIASMI